MTRGEPDPRPIHVHVVDDDPLARQSIIAYLKTAPEIIATGATADGAEARRILDASPADVVVMDLRLPGLDGIETTKLIRAAHPDTRVLLMTGMDDPTTLNRAMTAGVSGYVLNTITPQALIQAVRGVNAGLRVIMHDVVDSTWRDPRLWQLAPSPPVPRPVPEMTVREREVLNLLLTGASNTDMASRLFVSTTTVKDTLSSLMRKFDARSRTQLAIIAIGRGVPAPSASEPPSSAEQS
ncbi:MAG: response regulator transcription factor [Propioniciclava sp.]|uniref:response regulator transcription factor n=1 Tax=Propioniciclava sp. TaxID=2038686 RepID=UPI0039E4C903